MSEDIFLGIFRRELSLAEAAAEAMVTDIHNLPDDYYIEASDCLYLDLPFEFDLDASRIVLYPEAIDSEEVYAFERLQEKYGDRLAKWMYQQQAPGSKEFRSYITIGLGLSEKKE